MQLLQVTRWLITAIDSVDFNFNVSAVEACWWRQVDPFYLTLPTTHDKSLDRLNSIDFLGLGYWYRYLYFEKPSISFSGMWNVWIMCCTYTNTARGGHLSKGCCLDLPNHHNRLLKKDFHSVCRLLQVKFYTGCGAVEWRRYMEHSREYNKYYSSAHTI